jgi:hypothetical protein
MTKHCPDASVLRTEAKILFSKGAYDTDGWQGTNKPCPDPSSFRLTFHLILFCFHSVEGCQGIH